MIINLLEAAGDGKSTNNVLSWVLLGVVVVLMVGLMFVMNRRSKKRQQEADEMIDAVKPGNKVKTIGGVCGIVVEVDKEENTFVLETGSETTGKCYMKFDRQAIFQSDAVVEKSVPATEEKEAGEPFEQEAAEESVPAEQPAEEQTPEEKD